MEWSFIFSGIGLCTSVSSIFLAFLAFKRNERLDHKSEGKGEGLILSDVGYIKACVDRMEKNLTTVDERYRSLAERMAKFEEGLINVRQRLDELVKEGG